MRFLFLWFSVWACLSTVAQSLRVSISVQNTNCQPNGGAAQLVVEGGTAPYSYLWSDASTAGSISGLAQGNYSVTVYSAGKVDSLVRTFVVSDAATISFTITPNDTICSGTPVTIGAIAQPAGGTFTWSGGDLGTSRTGDTIQVAPTSDQTYMLVYTNPACGGNSSVRIESGVVKASLGGVTQPTCGLPNGSIIGAGTGYRGAFTWLKDGQLLSTNASVLSNLSSGTYTFILTDLVAGCSDTIDNIVLQDVTTYATISSISVVEDRCLQSTGSITVTPTGGSGNYTYKWSHTNSVTTPTAGNLAKGNYTVTISDGVCTPFDTTIEVTGPATAVSVSATGTTDNCSSSIGAATVVATDGTAPYTFAWSTGATGQSVGQLAGNNTYSVTVTDRNSCTAETTVSIGDVPAPDLKFFPSDSLCPGLATGVLKVNATGGESPYTYTWSHSNSVTGDAAGGLKAGTYTVTVTDKGGCTATATTDIAEYDNPSIKADSVVSVFKGETAELEVTTTLPVTSVKWFPYIQSADNSLVAYVKPNDTTTYAVTVNYGKCCVLSTFITVNVIETEGEVIFPNIFTPNGDGVNDNFYISATAVERFDIRIFDRWGNKVYESNDVAFVWDGINIYTASPAPNGVFTYAAEYTTFNSKEKKIAKGSITLVR